MKPLGWLIAVSALLITVPRYTSVFAGIDDTWLTALGMGILLAGGAAYIFHAWARTKRKDAWMLLIAFAANLAYEPIIITPFVMARLWGMDLARVMSTGYAVFWSFMVASAPVILIAGVVLAISYQRDKRPRTKAERSRADTEPIPNECDQLTEQAPPFTCLICGRSFDSQAALSGHGNKHRTKSFDTLTTEEGQE